MSANILDGKKLSTDIKNEIRAEVSQITQSGKRAPHLVAILVGGDPASQSYVRNKMRSCEYVGFSSTLKRLPSTVTEEELLEKVRKYNDDPDVDGIIVQMPLPEHITPQRVTQTILPTKDVDGFHPVNVGLMTLNFPCLLPATPQGILEMLERYNIPTKGKHCVVVGRSRIVGRPTSIMMSRGGHPGEATVTITHKYTPAEELKRICPQGDIVIVAVGKPGLITAEMIKPGAVVIDVGINRVKDDSKKSGYALKGDVDFGPVSEKASFITPVPGGVGPMTVAMLLRNTLLAYKMSHGMAEMEQMTKDLYE
ncbi:bifunctional 5,10-methylenetetrahydrofolate dehydrogenase/5,10-methenyltetrahydrofolate cyclohydrolase [Pontibacter sp. G13]|nr:bifunctional 5,10-methylenetetrahydrofolate dehydrogenase/5,10-methenyltetrahydrofolate cyclohydrolase [Pontibacter sp. G13]WNJ16097.1 bifunctional 5,10-methylenetetrahydrofolate dehydrogenase/5,10-methenyltetrahydrofolate cyclohydrolase [Pontibacter sp. G13]